MENAPQFWRDYIDFLPILNKAVKWEPLRQWSLSEVWRIVMPDGNTMIAKIGKEINSGEVSVYKKLLIPFELNVPAIYNVYEDNKIGALIMEDLKGQTIEESPQFKYFVKAAQTLSSIRTKARVALTEGKLTNKDYLSYLVSKKDVLNDLTYINQQTYIEIAQHVLKKALEELPKHLNRLYKEFPKTLTHNDYHPKNLLIHDEGLAVIDWSSAYISPHLGDLYCLITSAKDYNISPTDLITAFCENIDENWAHDIEWQINIGGICWTIHVVRWLLDYGLKAIPIASEWIPDLVLDIGNLVEDLSY
ncbi:aminoglycoside phosphotransferase family protein [Pseudalkalibacillus salsuginis]|uniref:aminoglycoside phosphotransferase family protein n=1 Tax=Pseudalkalibacillus salsuginis TaxID=2910972 RepID=UPI001F2383C0|nr:aminoglycoside phosphotransferase family protein [Pseudalkalibacillus salsuginis]MCF6409112.1 aminoglycoside phosphotransferase family protein [Pseudalkalibacillus salsuginis]